MKSFIEDKLSTYLAAFNLMSASSDVYLASLEKVLDLGKGNKIQLVDATPLSTYVAGNLFPVLFLTGSQ